MGVTTPPRGKRSEQCEVPNKAASDFNLEDSQLQPLRTDKQWTMEYEVFRQLDEKLVICQRTAILNQKELQAAAIRVEADAEADRLRAEATLAKAASDREVAR